MSVEYIILSVYSLCIFPPFPPFHLASIEAEELGSREIEIENKVFVIEVKANDQGHFVKILEVRERGGEERRESEWRRGGRRGKEGRRGI